MTQQYMLLFTLGPVQSFIAQARKTRDLWLGSYLLSVLMEAAMEGMDDVLVFPANPHIKGKIPDLPNKYIAIYDTAKQATDAARDSEIRIKSHWKSICSDVWSNIVKNVPLSNKETENIWDRQVDPNRFFEVFWVVVEGDRNNYAHWLTDTQIALAARKRLRHVQIENPVDDKHKEVSEKGEKSTISGDREALRSSDMYREQVREYWKGVAKRLSPFDINPSGEERLDAIDTVKRFAYRSQVLHEKLKEDKVGFPSTSSIATASFVEHLFRQGEDAIKVFAQPWMNVTKEDHRLSEMPTDTIPYLTTLTNKNRYLLDILRCDGDCYFPETFVSTRLEKDYGISKERGQSNDIAFRGQQGLRKLLEGTNALNITRPTPYYAMIQMDGDKMGVLLSNVSGETEHKKISQRLSAFSQTAETLVEERYPGRLIYAGGDDVFALAPLARDSAPEGEQLTVLGLVDELQQTYQNVVSSAVLTDERRKTVTASTGIAIAHHYTSLSYVRRASKDAESQAKKTYGRNSLVVTLLRRSGEQTRVGCRWHYEAKDKNDQSVPLKPIDLFSEFYTLFKKNQLSSKAVYILLEEVPALVHPVLFLEQESEMAKHIRSMQTSEIKRVLRRQRRSKDEKDGISDDETKRLAENLVMLARAMDEDKRNDRGNEKEQTRTVDLHSEKFRRYGLVEVLGWLQVMVFLTRKEQE